MTNLFRVSGGGLPAGLQTDMDAVLNKKFSTSTTYPPLTWPSNVNLLGPLPLRTASGSIVTITDGADNVPIADGVFEIDYDANGYSEMNIGKDTKYGGFVDFNQLAKQDSDYWYLKNATVSFTGTTTKCISATSSAITKFAETKPGVVVTGHVYFIVGTNCYSSRNAAITLGFYERESGNNYEKRWAVYTGSDIKQIYKVIGNDISFRIYLSSAYVSTEYTTCDNLMLIDLTQMFGATKAEEILAMETQTEGAGVAYVESLLTESYYAYTTGGTLTTIDVVNGDAQQEDNVKNIEFPTGVTIYGGYFDSVTGLLFSTKASDGTDLATPVEYQLQPVALSTEYLDNNFWCNTGDSSITYRADIDALITELGG